jgi:hypothetical protein
VNLIRAPFKAGLKPAVAGSGAGHDGRPRHDRIRLWRLALLWQIFCGECILRIPKAGFA